MAKPVKVAFLADNSSLDRALSRTEASLDSVASTARTAGAKIDGALDSTAERADTVASKGAQAAGALSGLGELVGGRFGTAMQAGGVAMQAAADAGDLLNVITDSAIVRKAKDVVATVAHRGATIASTAATKGMAAAQRVLNLAMRASPIGLVITAVAALVAGVIILYKRSETFRAVVKTVVEKVKGYWNAFRDAFGVVKIRVVDAVRSIGDRFSWIRDKAGDIVSGAKEKFNNLIDFFRDMPGRIRSKVSGMWDAIPAAFKGAINKVIGWWNNLSFYLNIPDAIPGLPDSFTISTPNIPYLAQGGIITKPTLAVIGEAGPEAVVPLNRSNLGNTYIIRVDVPPVVNPVEVGRQVVRAIEAFEGPGGRRSA